MKAEIFVLNYNGHDLLPECLPSILAASEASPVPCPVTVIDNASTDDSLGILKHRFPGVRVLSLPNRVLCSFNDAAKQSDADVVILLNNDLKADANFVAPLVQVFEQNEDAFMAGPQAHTFDRRRYEGSLSKVYFRNGLIGSLSRFPGHEEKLDKRGYTMQSGFGAFHRERFLALGGYDDLYLPGTVEDLDLCWRAWKAGFACYYAPRSRMSHKGQATFKRTFGRSRLLAINQRNLYLFIWKNITDAKLLRQHALWFFVRPVWFLVQGRPEFLWGFLRSFGRLPQALSRRAVEKKKKWARTDAEILAISENI